MEKDKKLKNLIDKWAEAVYEHTDEWKRSPEKMKTDLDIRSEIHVVLTKLENKIDSSLKESLGRIDQAYARRVIKHELPLAKIGKSDGSKTEWWKNIKLTNKKYEDNRPAGFVSRHVEPRIVGKRLIYSVKVIAKKELVPAKLIQDQHIHSLTISFENKEYTQVYVKNWYKTLRNLDRQVNQDGYKILCNGTAKGHVCRGFCIEMGDGVQMYDWRKPLTRKSPMIVATTFGYDKTLEYATEEEQEEFYNAK